MVKPLLDDKDDLFNLREREREREMLFLSVFCDIIEFLDEFIVIILFSDLLFIYKIYDY
jgi:hypothetical protein